MSSQRLQKVLARAGIASRRKAEELIAQGRVRVNGQLVQQQGTLVEPARDRVEVDGKAVRVESLVYLLFHKPREVVCTMSDPRGRATVADYVRGAPGRVVPVGRLDYQTSGVLVLTNDGDLNRALAHPSGGVRKVYSLKVKGRVDEEGLQRFRDRLLIDGRSTRPARVERVRAAGDRTWLSIELREGRNRQVRRLAEHAGYPVMRLSRVRFAHLTVSDLPSGRWRALMASEVEALRQVVRSSARQS